LFTKLKPGFILIFILLTVTIYPLDLFAQAGDSPKPLIYTVEINDTVTVGTAKHINRVIKIAESENAEAVVILLNTPGGLVTATLDIIGDISTSRVPVITYVMPQGAIAASAGTFILLDGHVAAMSPGTTCGAAMPVNVTAPGTAPQAADEKTINFLAGHMKSIAQERGRPADIAEQFVKENLTLNYQEALDKGVVDLIAVDLAELLEKTDGMQVKTDSGFATLNTGRAEITNLEMKADEKFIHLVSNPTLAMIFLILGLYGLIIGFSSPGFIFPEVLGSISLILGLYGVGLFEVNLAAGLLVLLGIGLLIAEAFTPTYGVLAVGGVSSIVLGILFFPVEPLMPTSWFADIKFMAVGVGLVSAVFVFVILLGIIRLRKVKVVHGDNEFKNTHGTVVTALKPYGSIKIRGEIWKAVSKNGNNIPEGEKVEVVERKGMLLVVELTSTGAGQKEKE
jgi:membrane-bound serine protease (ClpP class)